MNSTKLSEWAYYVISYSPYPENNECVNVGLLITDEKKSFLTYDEKFPKLHSIGTSEDEAFLRLTFNSLLKKSTEPKVILERIKRKAPQFIVSQPYELLERPDSSLLNVLKKSYLAKPAEHKKLEKKREKFLTKLDYFLFSKYRLSRNSFRKNVELKEFVSQDIYSKLPTQKHKISRCYDSQKKVVFIDTISLHQPLDAIMHRFTKINKVFWQYGKYRKDIFSFTGKKPYRVGIILNGIESPDRDLIETHNFVKSQWMNNAETVIDSDMKDEIESLSDFF